MKKYISYMAFCLLALLTACNTADLVDIPSQGDGRITLSFTTQGDETRAVDLNSVGAEARVTHIDLFIVKTVDSSTTVKHERVTPPTQGTTVTLTSITKADLQSGTTQIYGVANSSKPDTEMAALITNFSLDNLKRQVVEQTDYIHLTGSDINGVPEAFLMWGQAKYSGNIDITVGDSVTGDVDLTIELVRAAAKVTINFKLPSSNRQLDGFGLPSAYDATSKKITDLSTITYSKAGSYYLRNMPYKSYFAESYYVDNSNKDNYLRKTNEIDYGYYNWTKETVTVTAYVYSYEWEVSESSFENEPTMIVNLPAVQKDDATTGTYLDNNYYEIPLRMPKSSDPKYDRTDGAHNFLQLKRNHHYVINATVNAPGSKSKFEPMEIEHIDYAEYPWRETTVNIGGDGGAKYLTLNTNDFDMRNIETDNSTLKFYSSSPLTKIELLSASYIDKFGQTVQMINDRNYTNIINNIETTYTDGAITGPITIDSPLPENDAVRTMRFRVTNEDGLTQEFVVMQYPAITITNQQAYFSYRLDFESHYSNPEPHSSGNYRASASWSNNRWSYESDSSGNMFASKRAVEGKNGQSSIYYYYWEYQRRSGQYELEESKVSGLNNARIYHVTVNATSKDYTIARPRMTDDGYTDPGADNSKLVSPSFMIASQLGATQSGYDHEKAKQHCKQYVEVYLDENGKEVHLTGWRLPTDAEIKIITERQYQQNAAVDEVLGGRYYHSASDYAITRETNDDGTYTRCIRDHFEEVAPKN